MKAAVLFQTGQDLSVKDDIEIPPLRKGQVLVEIAYSGICHSQLNEIRGYRGKDRYLPHLLGHEASGRVVKTGEGVSKVKQGDLVILGWIKGKGLDAGATIYSSPNEQINSGAVTTFSDFSIVSENRCYLLPDGIPMDEAVLLGCAVPTGAGIVMNEIQPLPNSTIAIYGLGGIGLSALLATRLYSFKTVIAVDVENRKLDLARDMGAHITINAKDCDPVEQIHSLTDNIGVDYSIDAAGQSKTIEQAFRSVRNGGGLCVFASHPEEGENISLDPYHLICGKRIRGSWGGACQPDEFIRHFGELYREGRFPLKNLLSRTYQLDEINTAVKDMEHRKIERALLKLNPDIG